ncbi:MAG: D-alanyl-D-alanine carboxypeptidase [Clostridia bacterium]|nr:D-alanyl-D-alanine carboxypeptidase [Clostridia bacterium]
MGRRKRAVCLLISVMLFITDFAKAEAKAYILMDADTGRVLYEKNADTRLAIASTTKIMTCLIALESSMLTEKVTASKNASGVPGTSIYLSEGETLSMEDMLYSLMLRSGNDAAVAIAEHIAGTTEEFASLMNKRAKEIGADAYFTTPNGLDEGENGASARGITLISKEALKSEEFRRIVSTQRRTIPWKDHEYERVLTNKNRLLKDYGGAIGIKTGYTKKAGRCLVFAAERENMTLVGAVLNCPNWFDEAQVLLDRGFEEYDARLFYKADEVIETVVIDGQTIRIGSVADVKIPVKTGEEIEEKTEFTDLALPIDKGQIIGKLRLYSDEKEVASFDLLSLDTKKKPSFANEFMRILSLWTLLG